MKKNRSIFRPAFTMLELIFVIVILGIVAAISSQLIAQVYDNYLVQRAMHKSSAKTELVATQIANRLAYAIPNTLIARDAAAPTPPFYAIENAPTKNYDILEWIAYDADSFGYIGTPGWSGFCDVKDTSVNTLDKISTPGSTLGLASTVITNLTGNIANGAVLFPGMYNVNTVGFNGGVSNAGVSNIASVSGSTITFDAGPASRTIKEHYKLAWTAYAIVPIQILAPELTTERGFETGDEIFDLELHYDFQPWNSKFYNDAAVKKKVLIRNVSVFNFMGTGDTIRFKLCIKELIGGTYPITICKEKAVIR